MDNSTVTVVLPTYNRSRLLRRAIRSIKSQTYPHFLIHVYDNASTDDTRDVVQSIAAEDARLQYHRHERNMGAVANALYGMRHIETPFFHVLSDDDLIFADFFAEAISWLNRVPAAGFAAGGTLEATPDGALLFSPQAYWPRDGSFGLNDGLPLLLRGFHPSWTTMVFRRSVLDLIGAPNPNLPNLLDLDFTLRVATRLPFAVFRRPSGIFLRHASSAGDFADYSVITQYETMIEQYSSGELPGHVKALFRTELREQMGKRVCQIAAKQLLRGDARTALETLASYHKRYAPFTASLLIRAIAGSATIFPPLVVAARALDALRRSLRTSASAVAGARNAAPRMDPNKFDPLFRYSERVNP